MASIIMEGDIMQDRAEQGGTVGLARLLSPRSIAMVGATNNAARIGGIVFANLKRLFKGPLYAVHPNDREVMGVQAWRSIEDVPGPVDLAIIAVPAQAVPDVLARAAACGVGGAVILSAGFGEAGGEGELLQARIADTVARTGIRVVGPNCIGFMNLAGGVIANFSMSPAAPLPQAGGAALVSQSGGFGSYIVRMALQAGLKLGSFVSTGNEVDVSVASIIAHLVEQPEVKVVMACAETLRDPDLFVHAAGRALQLDKPIVLLKAGRSEQAARAALSHTGSIAGSAEVADAVCRQYGVHIARTMQELLDYGLALQDGRRARGNRLGIVTTSGGAGVAMADEAEQAGLTVPELPAAEQEAMLAEVPQPFHGALSNPVDTTAQIAALPGSLDRITAMVARSSSIDLVTIVTWPEATSQIAAAIELFQSEATPMALLCSAPVEEVQRAGLPLYPDPARAVRALGVVARQSLERPALVPATMIDIGRAERARAILADVGAGRVLMEHEGKRLLAEYGVPVTQERLAASPQEAGALANEIGGRVVLKVMSRQILHKSDVGGVRVGLSAEEVPAAAAAMLAEVEAKAQGAILSGILVQQMVPARLEITCGLRRDPVFGPMIVAGLGGVLVEVLAEVAMLRPPFDKPAALRAISRLCGGRLVSGARALNAGEQHILAGIMTALGAMATELPEILEIDVNPVRVADGHAVAADALVVLEGAESLD